MKNILTSTLLLFVSLIFLLVFASCEQKNDGYKFPLKKEDIEEVCSHMKMNWSVIAESKDDYIFTLGKNDNKDFNSYATVAVKGKEHEKGKFLSVSWFLHSPISKEQADRFYEKDIYSLCEIATELYGGNSKVSACLKDFFDSFDNHYSEDGSYFAKRIGNEHLCIDIKTMQGSPYSIGNNVGEIEIVNHDAFEAISSEVWEKYKNAKKESLTNVTVEELKSIIISQDNPFSEVYVEGRLTKIEKVKSVTESFNNTFSYGILNKYKDHYLMGTLYDQTAEINVIIKPTALTFEELGEEREHQVLIFYNEGNPFFIIKQSVLIE